MSTDNKNILLIFLLAADLFLGIMFFSTTNDNKEYDNERKLKSKPNIYTNIVEKNNEIIEEEKDIEVEPIVFDNLTYNQLVTKLNNSLNDDLSNKGDLIASYSLELNVDPYLVTAIMLHETGCEWGCSYLVKACNNVGGQVGYGCNGFSYFETLDDGIRAMIYNVYSNYFVYGLTTAELMNPKYAESPTWGYNVNRYIEKIRNN